MIIGILSDTHIPVQVSRLPRKVIQAFHKVDLILEVGDSVACDVCQELQQLARVEAVAGNMDNPQRTRTLPSEKEIAVDGSTLGLIHIHGWSGSTDLPQPVRVRFRPDIDCTLFGHSHLPWDRRDGKTPLFNAGSLSSTPAERLDC